MHKNDFNRQDTNEILKQLPELKIGKHTSRLPIIQGGMGLGISTHKLVGAVAHEEGIGTLTGFGLYKLSYYKKYRKKLYQERKDQCGGKLSPEEYKKLILEADAYCMKHEVKKAKAIAKGKGLIFTNILKAIKNEKELILAACEAGTDGIVCGAGLPFDLPETTKDYPDVGLIPILSSLQGVKIIIEKRKKYEKIPDAIILEDPSRAGGHLGAATTHKINDEETRLERALPEVLEYLTSIGLKIPVIVAGDIVDREDIDKRLALGASGVQMGTRFLASKESGAHKNFKKDVVHATKDDIFKYMSNAGLPASALKGSKTFDRIKDIEAKNPIPCKEDCLKRCARRDAKTTKDGKAISETNPKLAQMCIFNELMRSTKGKDGQGLEFVGEAASRIYSIERVKTIMKALEFGSKIDAKKQKKGLFRILNISNLITA